MFSLQNLEEASYDEFVRVDAVPMNKGEEGGVEGNAREETEGNTIERLARQFECQGIQVRPSSLKSSSLWCLLCTAYAIRTTAAPLASCLVEVGSTEAEVRRHCATRDHLLRFEEKNPIQHSCPIQLHGQKMLLENHCIYPNTAFGHGKVLFDQSINDGVVIAQDVCGGVKLMPYHQYAIAEFVLPYIHGEVWCVSNMISKKATESTESKASVEMKRPCARDTGTVLKEANTKMKRKIFLWNDSDLLSKTSTDD